MSEAKVCIFWRAKVKFLNHFSWRLLTRMSTVSSIKSPKTGRWVTVRGQAYADLMGTKFETRAKKAKRVKRRSPGTKTKRRVKTLRRARPISLEESLKTVPKTRKARRRVLKKQIARKGEGRGGRTRGWAAAAPQRGREREALMAECGDECFLLPGRRGFPVCAALREGRGCAVDCRGVTSAKVRAAQWKYPRVYQAAEDLDQHYNCANRPKRKVRRT